MPPLKAASPSAYCYGSILRHSQRFTLSSGGGGSTVLSSTLPFTIARLAFYAKQPTATTSFSLTHCTKRFSSTNTPTSTRSSKTAALPRSRKTLSALSSKLRTLLLNPARKGAETYGSWQRKSPYKTQFYTSLIIYALGDIGAQSISINGVVGSDEGSGGRVYDPLRTLRALAIGGLAAIPTFKWYVDLM